MLIPACGRKFCQVLRPSRRNDGRGRAHSARPRPLSFTCRVVTWLALDALMLHGPQADGHTAPSPAPLFTPVHPPETNVQQQLYPYPTGVDESPEWFLDPLETENLSINFRHTGWANDRRRVHDSLQRTHQPLNRLHDFRQCGSHAYVLQSVEDPDVYTLGGSTCHDRFCLPCARERSRVIATNVKDKLEAERARFLTLTLKSTTEPLAELLTKLTTDFATLRRSTLWRNKVTGGVAFLEVKWIERTERWHVHLHALVQGRYVPQDELSKTWLRITGTSHVIDIRIANDNAHVTHYITKYASKPLDHTVVVEPARLDEAVLAMKGKRLCTTFGSWRGYKLTEPPESGTWVQLGTLDEILARAEAGDCNAGRALDALRIEYAPQTRAPPKSPAPNVSSLTAEQRCLTYSQDTTHESAACGTRFVRGE